MKAVSLYINQLMWDSPDGHRLWLQQVFLLTAAVWHSVPWLSP